MANLFSKETIEELKSSINIIDVISHYVKLNRKGANYLGICPFHNDTHSSLTVNPKKNIFKCFACNASGDMFKFVQMIENVKFNEAVKIIAEMADFEISAEQKLNIKGSTDKQLRLIQVNNRANEFYTGILYNDENKYVVDYLAKRGLTKEIIKQFKIGYAPNSKTQLLDWVTNKDEYFGKLDKSKVFNEQELIDAGVAISTPNNEIHSLLVNRVTFPIYDINNNLVAFSGRDLTNESEVKYLHTPNTPIFNKSKILYNFNNVVKIPNLEHLIIVEGFMDCIAYYKAGYSNCVATMGTALTIEHIKAIRRIKGLRSVILSFDNDNAGLKANLDNAKLLLDNGIDVNIVNYSGIKEKDIDEIQLKYGNEAVKNLINNREDYCMFLIKNTKNNENTPDVLKYKADKMLKTIQDYGNPYLTEEYINEYGDITKINKENLKCRDIAIREINKIKFYFRNGEYKLKRKIKELEDKIKELSKPKEEVLSFKKDKIWKIISAN